MHDLVFDGGPPRPWRQSERGLGVEVIMRRTLALATVAVVALTSDLARAASSRKADFPCKSCVTAFPDATTSPAPLLVVLHGDGGAPASMLGVWEKAATARGIVVFAPKCPVDVDCKNASWWRWGKDPSWFDAKIDAIAAERPIDRARVWAAGWSGGASYLGWYAPSLAGRFAALSFDGGGLAPMSGSCPKSCALDAHFLVGDKNPYHSYAVDLRDWFSNCNDGEVRWELLANADHGGEWKALTAPKRVESILDWFETKTLTCAVESPAPAAAPADEATIAAPAPTTAPALTPPLTPAPPPAPHVARCACRLASGDGENTYFIGVLAMIALALLRRFK